LPLCGEFEDIEHILRSYKDPEMCRYRKETWKQLEQLLRFAVDGTVCSAADEIAAYAASDPVQAEKHKVKLAKREEKRELELSLMDAEQRGRAIAKAAKWAESGEARRGKERKDSAKVVLDLHHMVMGSGIQDGTSFLIGMVTEAMKTRIGEQTGLLRPNKGQRRAEVQRYLRALGMTVREIMTNHMQRVAFKKGEAADGARTIPAWARIRRSRALTEEEMEEETHKLRRKKRQVTTGRGRVVYGRGVSKVEGSSSEESGEDEEDVQSSPVGRLWREEIVAWEGCFGEALDSLGAMESARGSHTGFPALSWVVKRWEEATGRMASDATVRRAISLRQGGSLLDGLAQVFVHNTVGEESARVEVEGVAEASLPSQPYRNTGGHLMDWLAAAKGVKYAGGVEGDKSPRRSKRVHRVIEGERGSQLGTGETKEGKRSQILKVDRNQVDVNGFSQAKLTDGWVMGGKGRFKEKTTSKRAGGRVRVPGLPAPGVPGFMALAVSSDEGGSGDRSVAQVAQDATVDCGHYGPGSVLGKIGAGFQTVAGSPTGGHAVVVDLTGVEDDSETLVTGRPGARGLWG